MNKFTFWVVSMNNTARQNESLVYPVKTATPPIVEYTLIASSILILLIAPISNKNRPTHCPNEAPIKSPGKNKPAGRAIPYSKAQKKNQSTKNAIAT